MATSPGDEALLTILCGMLCTVELHNSYISTLTL